MKILSLFYALVLEVTDGWIRNLDEFTRRMKEGPPTWSGNMFFCKNKFALVRIAVCTRS